MRLLKKRHIILVNICFAVLFTIFPTFASGEMKEGNVELNNGNQTLEAIFGEDQQLAPSQIVTSKEIKIINTGTLSLKMFQEFFVSLKQTGYTNDELSKMLDKYSLRVHWYKNGKEIKVNGISNSWINANEFNTSFNKEGWVEVDNLKASENLSMVIDVKLDENAGNEYQGALLNISLVGGGGMTTSEDEVIPPKTTSQKDGFSLPNTATNNFNLLIFGIILVLLGIRSYYFSNRKNRRSQAV
jgi:LPXTG-motif cell wall-anchored protein